jgi:hypothetical protein
MILRRWGCLVSAKVLHVCFGSRDWIFTGIPRMGANWKGLGGVCGGTRGGELQVDIMGQICFRGVVCGEVSVP